MKKLVAITILLLGLLSGLLFSVTAVSANPCQILQGKGDVSNNEAYTKDFVKKCNASLINAYQNAKSSAFSNANAVAIGDYSTAGAASNATADADNTINVYQANH